MAHPSPISAPDAVASTRALFERGRYVDALRAGPDPDLRKWPTEARVLAAQLATRLGGARLSQALVFRAHRDAPDDLAAGYAMARLVFIRRGPWHCLEWMRARPALLDASGDLTLLRGSALGELRDFERAERALDDAERGGASVVRLALGRARVAELADDVPRALALVDEALARRPESNGLIARRAYLLSGLGRAEDALDGLHVELTDQSWELLWQRGECSFTLRRYADCERDLDAAHAAALLLDRAPARRLATARAEAAYLQGAHRRAEGLARTGGEGFPARFADALSELEDGAPPPRVELEGVPHIRQHHQTCMPASLASITAFHGDPVDHLEIAQAICYAGTPFNRGVRWARDRGYEVRLVDLDFDRAKQILDAGFPIALSTGATVTAHTNVVIGCDLVRKALLIRDPSTPHLVELPLEELEKQSWYGPCAMVMAPAARAEELRAMDLGPTSALWDLDIALSEALDAHDTEEAARIVAALEAAAPGSRLALLGALDLARYEGKLDAQVAVLDALLALHPDTRAWIVMRGEAMHESSSVAERVAFWSRHEHLDDPSILESFAETLRGSPATQERAGRLLRRAIRLAPWSGMAHHVLADLGTTREVPDVEVLESYRFGTCLSPINEHFARAYHDHARVCGREEEALAHLRRRAEAADDRAVGPAQTLYEVYLDSGNPERGVALLEELAAKRPEDGDLALLLVRAHLSAGAPAEAAEWLERARARAAREVDRLLQSAALARVLGDLDAAAEALDRAHELLPWRMDVLTSLADVALEREGHEAVVARVERAYAASPHEGAILVELVGWLRGHDDERRIELIRARVDARPDDHWARRELALAHAALGDQDTALELARDAVSRTPANSIAHGVLGGLLVRAGETEEGRASLRRAVELWVDNTSAIRELTSIGGDAEAEREDVRFLLDQLDRRVSAGPGVIEAAYAAGALPRGERLERMERLLSMAAHRPDAWEAVARARMNAGDIDEADELCARACERFPRWFQLRRLQAEVHRVSGDADAEEAALSELVELSPTWTDPRARLAQLTRARGAIEEARQVIEEGLRRTPRSAALRSELAALEWAEGERERAVDVLLAALDDGAMDDPMYRRLVGFARHLGRADEVEARLRAQTEARPRAGQPWFRLAELLVEPARAEDRLEAAREAFRRSPRHADAVDLVAMTLAEMGRYADALDACPPPEWVGPTPYTMVGRRAWVQWRMGQRDDAIEAMRAILAEVPDYAWGRQQLCDWLDFLGRREEFRAEATLLVREGPTVGQHHVYLADARRLTGDLSGAVESYERALELAPSHDYAAAQLVDVLLEQGEVDDAEDALERLQHTLRAADARHGAVRVAAARGHWDDALDALDALVSEDAPEVLVRAALQAFGGGPRFDAALARVEARFTDPDAPEAFGYAWADAARDAAPLGRVVRLRDAMGAAGMAAVSASLEHLAKAGHRWRLLWLALRHGGWLRRADDTWAAFGLALQLLGYNRIALWWLRDREARPEAKPWMLLTVVLSAWWLGRRALAEAAVSQALAAPRDHTSDRHAVWALFHRALRGEPIVEDLDALPAVGTEIGVLHLVDALRQAAALPDASDDDLVRAVRPCIAAAEALEPADGLLLEPIEKTVDHIVGDRPGPVFSRLRRAANE